MRIKILIILTISLMLIGGYYFSVVVFAESDENILKPLIVEVDTDIKEIINYENYVIVFNDVNVKKSGTYKIIYKNIHSNEEVEKTIYVIERDQKTFFSEELIYQEETIDDTYEIGDVFNYLDNPNCLYNYYYSTLGFNNYLNGEWNQNIHYNHTVSLRTKGQIIDAYVNDDQVIMIGTDINDMNGKKNTCIYTRTAKISKQVDITENGLDNPSCVAANNKYYFIAGTTNVSNELLQGKREGIDSYVAVVNRETKDIINVSMVQQKEDDSISEMVYYNNYLYLIQENNTNTIRVLKMDIFGNVIKENKIELFYEYHNLKFKMFNNKMYLSYSTYDYEKMDYINIINSINEELEIVEINKDYQNGSQIVDFEIDDELVFVLLTNKNNKCFEYLIYDQNNSLLGKYSSTKELKVAGLGSNNVIIGTSLDNKTLKYYQINSLIKVKEPSDKLYYNLSKENNETKINEYLYIINGKKIKHDEKSNLNYNLNLFGNYSLTYHFSSDMELYLERNIRVMPFIGALNEENYDIGLCIVGNGTLYVNNMLVEGDYIFNDIGEYEIKLVGKNNEIEHYKISVSDLSVKFNELIYEKEMEPVIDKTTDLSNIVIDKTFTEKTEINNNKKTTTLFYLIPAITLGVVLLLFKKGV